MDSGEPAAAPELDAIEASPRVRVAGNTRPEATAANDLGPVDDSLRLHHILLQLKREPAHEAALESWLDSLEDKTSPQYHQWLTPEEFGARFGVAQADIDGIVAWLGLHGISVHGVYPSRMTIDLSATAGQMRETFQTEIHAYEVAGVRHIANSSDPAVPALLAPRIAGIVSLHDFRPRSMLVSRRRRSTADTSRAMAAHPITASDLAAIYNLTPLFRAGYTGKGKTIALVEDSDIHASADWTVFRGVFGLAAYASGSLEQVHPEGARGVENCSDPGAIPGWDEEPILDAEYASAAAPGAAIELASCADTETTSGTLIALANLVNASGAHPAAISVSYGECEAVNGAGANAVIAAAYQQAVAEGISVFAAAGDGGAALCDMGESAATHGIGVNAYASTPWNVAVGGTDFSDAYSDTGSEYWNKSDSSTGGSAKSYVPEIPWDDSCASPLIAAWNGYATTFGPLGFCLADFRTDDAFQTTTAGSGGPSGCATGAPATGFIVSGGCRGYAKPGWQSVSGNPKDGLRDLPDLALFSGDGIWGHYFLFCDSNLNDEDGAPCRSTAVGDWSQGGGTSFAAPVMAGIQALVAQKWGLQGNPNPVYYKLAAAQLASGSLKSACNASLGVGSASGCVFHDVTGGASDVNCQGAVGCYLNVLSTNPSAFDPAFAAQPGWDFATGLGSVNAFNLVTNPVW